ncbi:MAG: AI-2E family transporter [Chlorobi bacterium]|jgi:predicted PurR-regulated permease PerM|uniref:AI-2E family transporter n=2 Tax=Chryseobacterium TaxID=59732 RepID=A0AAJ1R2E2_9FLAO|nr:MULTISPECIES: AI-2E family transporter [Chryseobacterium]NPA07696.1 AI-2E family transporter [Chlorobiota bacterium]MCF2220935.1 AI-2E family transporter [Chryseobacterium sp. PS-8]MDN4012187.1 AI-2E family transporter [Chryseobacterium gambrini]MDN4029707.1 AI-2E family transporter [Chryseobacterium gambrini]QWA37130.1 AI-2E family transporter [Chryseobacterium sp. ZHDP1]
MNKNEQISSVKIKQVFLLAIILVLTGLICYNLALFIPSVLGAITIYVVCRKYNFYLQEEKNWKPWLASLTLMFASLVILILPIYFIGDLLIEKLGNAQAYMDKFNVFLEKIHTYIFDKVGFDILSKENMDKLKSNVGQFSTKALSGTVNTLTVVMSMYFILYFMLAKPRFFERILSSSAPLKRANVSMIGEKMRKLIMANAIGIPVVAIGQGIVALVGYFIFDAPSPVLLFALTAAASMVPVVGAAIVYIPVCIYMIAEGNTGTGLGLAAYCLIVVGLTDNVLRFTLLKKLEDIHPLNTVFGIIMGMNLFGFMGLVFGPILISLTLLLIQVYRNEFSDDDTPELELPNKNEELEGKIDLMI